jgi:ApaG protein
MAAQKKYEISVQVKVNYVPEHDDAKNGQYAFSYTVTIKNLGAIGAQLISRYWMTIDANAHVQETRGLGVIGQQPLLPSGAEFTYSSGCILATPVGSMKGRYHFVAEDGMQFDVTIPEFTLAMPNVLH